jgi:hypothetical protein
MSSSFSFSPFTRQRIQIFPLYMPKQQQIPLMFCCCSFLLPKSQYTRSQYILHQNSFKLMSVSPSWNLKKHKISPMYPPKRHCSLHMFCCFFVSKSLKMTSLHTMFPLSLSLAPNTRITHVTNVSIKRAIRFLYISLLLCLKISLSPPDVSVYPKNVYLYTKLGSSKRRPTQVTSK